MNEFQDQRTTSMRDFLLQKPVVLMMVTQGDTSNFEYKWCNDGGANKSVSGNRADFTGNFRSVDIDVIVAKKGIVMNVVGMGDCDLHCVDNLLTSRSSMCCDFERCTLYSRSYKKFNFFSMSGSARISNCVA